MAFGRTVLGENALGVRSSYALSVMTLGQISANDSAADSAAIAELISDAVTAEDAGSSGLFNAPPAWRKFSISCDNASIETLAKKAAGETKNYEVDWSLDLGSDYILSSAWSSSSPDLSFSSALNTLTFSGVDVSGGVDDVTYVVTNTITTQSGDTLEASFKLYVTDYVYI